MTIRGALDAIKAKASSGNYVIKLSQDESNVSVYDLTGFTTPVSITIDGTNTSGGTHEIGWALTTSTSRGSMTIRSGVTLILKNVTFTGKTTDYSAGPLIFILSGGVFEMQDGAVLTGHLASSGGGVYVQSGGTFNMTGGSITGNKFANFGGGVYVGAGGAMTMTGGSITGNKHRTYDTNDNDVVIYASSSAAGSLTMSGDARIGRVWLYSYSATYLGTITIDDALSGSDTVATIDLDSKTTGRPVLKGDAVASFYDRFVLGNYRMGTTTAGSALTGYSIDTSGKLQK
jgi:hypothetical protein